MVIVSETIVPSTPGGIVLAMIMKLGMIVIMRSTTSVKLPINKYRKRSDNPKYLLSRYAKRSNRLL